MKSYIFSSLVLLSASSIISGLFLHSNGNLCTSPNNRTGICTNIRNCSSLLNVLLTEPLTPTTIDFLRQSQCGWEGNDPEVCCEYNSLSSSDLKNNPAIYMLNDNQCGTHPIPHPVQHIFSGVPAGVNEFPWMALLLYKNQSGYIYLDCGGSIINNRYILTAAHCVTKLPSDGRFFAVRVGDYDLTTERDCANKSFCTARYQDFAIEEVVSHPEFSRSTMQDDIALIRLNATIDLSKNNVRSVCLPAMTNIMFPNEFTVSGWGIYNNQLKPSSVIRKAELPHFSHEKCVDYYYKMENYNISNKQICAGGAAGVDGCRGDSGGPLQARRIFSSGSRIIQYGIVSFGPVNCGTAGVPGVYTRVDYYIDWILKSMRH